jgi:uncharacterized protein YejL (UPF0352 family)
MIVDPSEFSDKELENYLRELFDNTEDLNATELSVQVRGNVVHLTGDVPSAQQREIAEMLVLDIVPEDRLANDLMVAEDMTDESPKEPPEEPPPEIRGKEKEVEDEDADEAAQQGKPYEPPVSPRPESEHEGDW